MAQNKPVNQTSNQNQDQLSTYLLAVADTQVAREELAHNLAAIATAKVREAASFATAVAEFQHSERRVDLAIIDLEMASAAAVTLVRKLRDPLAFRARNIAILLIGGAANTPNYLAAARLGIQGHLPRPFTTDRLRQAIRAALLARPTEVAARPVAAVRETKVTVAEVAAPDPPPPYVPVANKPFQHGLQSRMRVVQSLSPEEAFGFEPAPSLRPCLAKERRPAAIGEVPFTGRRLTAVG